MTEPKHLHQDEWKPCQSGEISGLAGRLQTRRRLRTAGKVGAACVCLLGAVMLGAMAVNGPEHPFTPLACQQVLDLAPDYLAGTLDADQARLVSKHLDRCPHCHNQYAELSAKDKQHAVLELPNGKMVLLAQAAH